MTFEPPDEDLDMPSDDESYRMVMPFVAVSSASKLVTACSATIHRGNREQINLIAMSYGFLARNAVRSLCIRSKT